MKKGRRGFMSSSTRIWQSTVGKKFIMAISGLLLIGYLMIHLTANLLMFIPDGGRIYNLYAHTLHGLGPILTILRVLLAAFFIFHIVSGIRVFLQNRKARTSRYAVYASKGGPSKMSVSSRLMATTGGALLVFVPIHVWMFSLGAHYETVIDGVVMRDLYRLVVSSFKQPLIAFGYAAVMLLLWGHLRHGFWSALQSLGAMNPRWSQAIYTFGLAVAILLAGGFLILPLHIYFFVPMP